MAAGAPMEKLRLVLATEDFFIFHRDHREHLEIKEDETVIVKRDAVKRIEFVRPMLAST